MEVRNVNIQDVKPYPNNPRNNDQGVDAVAKSIKEFNWQQPIVVDKDNVIIVGHTRYKAAKKLGMDKVPVVVAGNLTDEQVKAYRLADNKTGDVVLDLFGGSGTTIMACEQDGRNACVVEYDPKYVDVIIKRWEDYTGKKAELIEG